MTAQGERRMSGRTTAEEKTKEASDKADDPVVPEKLDPEEIDFDTPAFQRQRTDWRGGDLQIIAEVHDAIDAAMWQSFWSAYRTLEKLHRQVRDQLMDPAHPEKPLVDRYGDPVWAIDEDTQLPREDWSRLDRAAKEDLLFQTTNFLVDWEQKAAAIRGDSLYAKAKWEELFAKGFESLPPGRGKLPTVEDREARARTVAAEERYFSVFQGTLSRRADALVTSMKRLHNTLQVSLAGYSYGLRS